MKALGRLYPWMLAGLLVTVLILQPASQARSSSSVFQTSAGQQPRVAIHVSELTQALETMPASGSTPTGSGTTGFQWWRPEWRYGFITESIKELLRSDGTPFAEVSDADISAGQLLTADGKPRYPIFISLASEAIRDDEITPLRNYVSAGGFIFAGSSAFTRNPNGTTRGDFALASELGLHTTNPSLSNWYQIASSPGQPLIGLSRISLREP